MPVGNTQCQRLKIKETTKNKALKQEGLVKSMSYNLKFLSIILDGC
jgi:hypothetical protein